MSDQLNDDGRSPTQVHGDSPSLVVGLGASAGGIKALVDFFRHVSPDHRIAYVVILHMSPDHESHLANVLQTTAPFPVTQVRESTRMQASHAYVISPAVNLRVKDGLLEVDSMTSLEERKAPVDLFFRTLADGFGPAAVAVVLSGTGPNGSAGLKRIKEQGGLVIVQEPEEAEFGDMPRNSIATGLVDYVMRVAAMPGRIAEYHQRVRAWPTPGISDPPGHDDTTPFADPRAAQQWRDIITLLRARTGQDFSNYKPATIRRRVERRMGVLGVSTLEEYARAMRERSDEALLLMKELLISVTYFFRDAEAFTALEKRVMPLLFQRHPATSQVRVWCAGCATGEEAYSIAMLLVEHGSTLVDAPAVQVFATDLDEHAIATAREGLYSESDVADVSQQRLSRFFQRETAGYRVRRDLREVVLFAHHNVVRDPPFSHLDLIVCRNLLIYLNRSIQERLLETFNFALRPEGFLFLGGAESADTETGLFAAFDKGAHIYESRPVVSRLPPTRTTRDFASVGVSVPRLSEGRPPSERISPGELHLRLLEQYAPPSIIVNEDFSVLHVSPGAIAYLQMAPGEPGRDVLRLVHPDLRADLRAALQSAARDRKTVEVNSVHVPVDGGKAIRLVVKPALREDPPLRGYFLVVFDENVDPVELAVRPVQLRTPIEPETRQLNEDLARVKTQLRSTIEQYETQSEEARAANEELQAMNEELRSAAEELETSKEELQSVSEELITVNQELKVKIEELGLSNNDLQNLMNSADIATIFLDRSLRVKLSTPRAADIFNLLPTDLGRKLSDITSRLKNEPSDEEMQQVLRRLHTIEREVEAKDGRWYLMRILPYRTLDHRIDGVAMTFHDITDRRAAEMQLRAAEEERLRLLIDSATDYAIFTMTDTGLIDSWNTGAERMFGYAASEIIGRHVDILFTPEDRAADVPREELKTAAARGRAADERWHFRKDESRFYCSGVTTQLGNGKGFAKIARDLTAPQASRLALEQAAAELENRVMQRTEQLEAEVERRGVVQEEITRLLQRLVTTQEEQRGRISRDLHDQLGQQLTALRLSLERHAEQCGSGVAGDLERALALTREIDAGIDFLAWELRPTTLDDIGLVAALPRYLDEWSSHHGIAARFEARGMAADLLSREVETAFYRIAQEALNNVMKHAQATVVDVVLEHRDGQVLLVIEDDGVGFDQRVEPVDKAIGLAGMRERAAIAGASLQVESAPGKGTTVYLRAPVTPPAVGGAHDSSAAR